MKVILAPTVNIVSVMIIKNTLKTVEGFEIFLIWLANTKLV